jgi:hypothetical protein
MMAKQTIVRRIEKRYRNRKKEIAEGWRCNVLLPEQMWACEEPAWVAEAVTAELAARLRRTLYWISSTRDTYDGPGSAVWAWRVAGDNEACACRADEAPPGYRQASAKRRWLLSTLPDLRPQFYPSPDANSSTEHY